MWTPLLALMLGCSGCGPGPEVSEPASAADPLAEPEPEQMAELAVPTHPDLVLGSLSPVPPTPMDYAGAMAAGEWAHRRTWSSRTGKDWTAVGPQILWVRSADPLVVDQLKPAGEEMVAFASHRLGRVGPAYGVIAARQSGGEELVDLATAELLLAKTGTTFRSPWMAQMVTIEVKGVQSVTVPGGSFDALWVQRTWAHAQRSTLEDTWWTPEHGPVAQVVRVQTHDDVEARLTVLVEYGSAAEPQVTRQVWADGLDAMGLGD